MFNDNRHSFKRRTSRLSARQRQVKLSLRKKTKPGLSLDTNFSRHVAFPPQQVFPSTIHTQDELQDGLQPLPQSKQLMRLKPRQADLDGISPSDRLISIGISVPQTSTNHAEERLRTEAIEESKTPVIVITPAKEDFSLTPSPQDEMQIPSRRAPSSVYSRYADVSPKTSSIPPVPPLPSQVPTTRCTEHLHTGINREEQATSICTVFEEDISPTDVNSTTQRPQTTSTPRRSNGWWNIVTSPFSAQFNGSFWKSPIGDNSDETPILQSRSFQQNEVSPDGESIISDEIDIYRVPSQGEAAAYYDRNRHFPSLLLSPSEALPKSVFEDDTPATAAPNSTHVYHTHVHEFHAMPFGSPEKDEDSASSTSNHNPFADDAAIKLEASRSLHKFSSPSIEELKTPRRATQTTATQLSPISPSPILGQAHIAQVIVPTGTDTREVKMITTPPIAPQGLGSATMASRAIETRPPHSRTSSHGLGIIGGQSKAQPYITADAEKSIVANRRPWYRRFLWLILAACVSLAILIIVLLVMHIPQKHNDMPVEAKWVNLTGYPPLPSGVMTVIQPKTVREDSGCVKSENLWSCRGSSEQQSTSAAGSSGVPNFRFEIRYRDTGSNSSYSLRKRVSSASLLARDAWSDSLYNAKPTPPSTADQIFLGNTTDNNTAPYDGESTPFYISLLDARILSKTQKRDSPFPYPTSDNSTSSSSQSIPKSIVNDDGTPTSAILYPLAEAQPLRLYKRGRQDEHYGFYTYFDKSIYISNSSTGVITSNVPLTNTTAVCTWSQSRFLVQIWTNGLATSSSIGNSSSSTSASNSSANNFTSPGSFPYAVTITIDRHGGDAGQKGVYCYGVDENHHVEQNINAWIDEDRAHGGVIFNAADIPRGSGLSRRDSNTSHGVEDDSRGGNLSQRDVNTSHGIDVGSGGGLLQRDIITSEGIEYSHGIDLSRRDTITSQGIDGGSGGCACAWQNW